VIRRAWRWFRAHREEERGAVLVLTAISMVAILGAGALGVDLGFTVDGSRQAQAMADTAAAGVVQYINIAFQTPNDTTFQNELNNALGWVLQDNNANAQMAVTGMLYANGTYSVPKNGCRPPNPIPLGFVPCNAVAVSAKQTVPQPFWGGFNTLVGKSGSGLPVGSGCGIAGQTTGGCGTGCSGQPCFSCPQGGCTSCPATACYTWLPQATFSIGSYLVNLNSSQAGQDATILSDILNTLGVTYNITAVGYQGLATTNVTIAQLITASNGQLTATDVMTTPLSPSQWVAIWTQAVGNQAASLSCGGTPTPPQCTAYGVLGGNQITWGNSSPVMLCQLVSVDGSTCDPNNSLLSYEQMSASLNVLQELTTEAELANSTNPIDITGGLNIAPLTSAQLTLNVLQPPQVATGPVGTITTPPTSPPYCPVASGTSTCATTAQIQADVKLSVLGVGIIDIPLSAAEGISTLNLITCVNNAMTNTKITSVTQTATATVTLQPGLGLPTQTIASLSVSGAPITAESYSASVVPPTASTAFPTPPTLPTNPLQLGTSSPQLTFTGQTGSWSLVSGLLTGAIDNVLGSVLQAAGVSVGGADVADLGTDCDAIGIAS
jgi:uncharacterized membrane protein